jgi:hypothetical protein
MNSAPVALLLLVVVPLAIALGGYTLLRRRGSRSGVAGCGAVLLGLFVSAVVIGVSTFTAMN